MDLLALISYFVLAILLAFGSASLTLAIHFGLGAPSESLDYIESNLFSPIGKWLLTGYAVFSAKHPKSINPYKAAICPYCLLQWVGLAMFVFFKMLWGMPWEFLIIHNAIAHVALMRITK